MRWRILAPTLGFALALPLHVGCKRDQASTPPNPDDATADGEGSADAPGSPPEGCVDAQDCDTQGARLLEAGQIADALAMFTYSCVADDARGCYDLTMIYRSGAVPPDPAVAHAAAKRGCELGHPSACVELGADLFLGVDGVDGVDGEGGVAQDIAGAQALFAAACERDEAVGCRYLGSMIHEGLAGPVDEAAALTLFEKACALQDGTSCFNIGVLLFQGAVGEQDLEGASGYMVKACELGEQDGCDAQAQLEQAIADQHAKVPKANLRVGSATVDGLTVNELTCRIDGGAGMLGSLAVIGALSKRKAKIDKCGAAGIEAEVHWIASGGKITTADGEGSEGACVAKVLKNLAAPLDGECAAKILLGPGS